MKRLTAYVSGNVHQRGYRARVTDIARVLGLKGTVENLDDGRVKIIAEGDEDKLKWFEEAICIKNTLIDVSSIEKEYSTPRDDVNRFYKLVDRGETDSRLDTAADHLKNLIVAVNNMNQNIGGKIDQMNDNLSDKIDQMNDNLSDKIDQMNDNLSDKIDQMNDNLSDKIDQMNDNLSGKMDVMIDLQKDTLSGQETLIEEVRQSRKEIKGRMDQRFDKLESEVAEMKVALKSKGII
ncbi:MULTISPECIES: acylphosphatase [Methanothrix]|jgi:acylphosphatase|uniref:acylphosphatase n=1 Tax=Methanothrix TaxID=2222 RepID=UPI0023552691|nr:acylphosphatase [Methanothrix soehngenii]